MKDVVTVVELTQRAGRELDELGAEDSIVFEDNHRLEFVQHPRHRCGWGTIATKIGLVGKGGDIGSPVDALDGGAGLAHSARIVGAPDSRTVDRDANNWWLCCSERLDKVDESIGPIESDNQNRNGLHIDRRLPQAL